ncbi:hypothetical protein MMC25_006477 [Agyrium rufum]|nr:hypothetical protein [Agyrium rufum]
MVIIKNVRVNIKVDGQKLREFPFQKQPDMAKSSAKYVQHPLGTIFTVEVLFRNSSFVDCEGMTAYLLIDGIPVASKAILKPSTGVLLPILFKGAEFYEDGIRKRARLVFRELDIISAFDVSASAIGSNYKDARLGEIEIRLGMGIVPRPPPPVPLEDRPIEKLTRKERQEVIEKQRARLAIMEAKVKSEGKTEGSECGTKRERDEELDEIMASAHVPKKVKPQVISLDDWLIS